MIAGPASEKAFVVILCLSTLAFAATKDYSGTFARQTKSKGVGSHSIVLRVQQTESGIEVTRTQGNKAVTNRFPLDGTEASYLAPHGARGKCKAQLKDKYLLLESVVTEVPEAGLPPVRVRRRESWRLSADSKALKVKIEIDYPDLPTSLPLPSGSAIAPTKVESIDRLPIIGRPTDWTEKFQRIK